MGRSTRQHSSYRDSKPTRSNRSEERRYSETKSTGSRHSEHRCSLSDRARSERDMTESRKRWRLERRILKEHEERKKKMSEEFEARRREKERRLSRSGQEAPSSSSSRSRTPKAQRQRESRPRPGPSDPSALSGCLQSSSGNAPVFMGPECSTPIRQSELHKIKVDIHRNIPHPIASSTIERRIVNHEDVLVPRREGEGSKPLSQRKEFQQSAEKEEVRTVSAVDDDITVQQSVLPRRSSPVAAVHSSRHPSSHSHQQPSTSRNSREHIHRSRQTEGRERRSRSRDPVDRPRQRRSPRRHSPSRERDSRSRERDSRHRNNRDERRYPEYQGRSRGHSRERGERRDLPHRYDIPDVQYSVHYPHYPPMMGPRAPFAGLVPMGLPIIRPYTPVFPPRPFFPGNIRPGPYRPHQFGPNPNGPRPSYRR